MNTVALRATPRASTRHTASALSTLAVFTVAVAHYVRRPMRARMPLDGGFIRHQAARLQGLALALPTALISLALGRWVDRTHRTGRLIVRAFCAAGGLLKALAQNFSRQLAQRGGREMVQYLNDQVKGLRFNGLDTRQRHSLPLAD
ncbi:MAG: hypothetical protein ACTS5I_01460 [Rhodanobacter sp.]